MYRKLNKFLDIGLKTILCLFIIGMVVLCFLQTVMRYLFNDPLVWSEEITRFLFIWMAFIGSSLATATKEHINVNIIPNLFSYKFINGSEIIQIVLSFLNSFFLLFLAMTGFQLVNYTVQVAPATFFPWKFVYLALPVGSLFMIFYEINFIVLSIKKVALRNSTR